MEGLPDIFCIPVKDKKKKKWHIANVLSLGQGQYGMVYGACKRTECKYVMKIIILGKKVNPSAFSKEVKMQQEIAEKGLTIPVEDHWRCTSPNQVGVIVMKSLDLTVSDFLLQDVTEKDVDEVIQGTKELVDKLHAEGYYHGDNHFRNIMMKRVPQGPNTIQTSLGLYRLYLIDMGKAGKLNDPGRAAYGATTTEKRIRDDRVILDKEIKDVYARLRPLELEGMIM